ncbi:hypothetical protein TSUD_320970 [Trifolium subterraneum]|uniref:TF-B3 domain-containing protein n=1 Tax=Trifolium subterraneum TaxID=3900 RepID=A0A2Z6N449_TRISU|nr:hypothetical protein TSUD_320970 [Trifolium subterraneum]
MVSPSNASFINCASFLNMEALHQIDGEQSPCLDDFVSKLQTFHLEFDAYSPLGRLPRSFVREFGNLIDQYVVLRDPNLNEIEVRVVKRPDGLYFEEGWLELKKTYNIWFGGWVTITYVNPKLLAITLMTRWESEVKYPLHSPPLKLMLARVGNNHEMDSSSSTTFSSGCLYPKWFLRSYFKELTNYDVHSGILILPWYAFGQSAFAYVYSDLVLEDYTGARYQCNLQFGVDADGEFCCKVYGEWIDFCKAHHIQEGQRVRFAVTEPSSNYVLYVCVYPQIGLQTTLSYPLGDGSYLPLYVSQQYFIADY